MKPALVLIAEVVVPMVTEGAVVATVTEGAVVATVAVEVADPGGGGSEDIELSGRYLCLIVVLVLT